ncbi:uncharacterized protein V6R79_001333 [Siganus canaliculatus]
MLIQITVIYASMYRNASLLIPPSTLSAVISRVQGDVYFTSTQTNTTHHLVPGLTVIAVGSRKQRNRLRSCSPGEAILYKLHLGFAYFRLHEARHIWKKNNNKKNTGAECTPQSFRQSLCFGKRSTCEGMGLLLL